MSTLDFSSVLTIISGYQLCDNSVGVLYNDQTRMILHEDGEQVQYLTKNMKEEMFRLSVDKPELKKKVSLVNYFKKHMNEHLLKVSSLLPSFPLTF